MPSSQRAQAPARAPVRTGRSVSLRWCRTAYLPPISSPPPSHSLLSAWCWFTGRQDQVFICRNDFFFHSHFCPFVCRMSTSFGSKFGQLNSTGNLAIKVFCCWDFKVTKRISVRLQSKTVSTQLKVWNQLQLPYYLETKVFFFFPIIFLKQVKQWNNLSISPCIAVRSCCLKWSVVKTTGPACSGSTATWCTW